MLSRALLQSFVAFPLAAGLSGGIALAQPAPVAPRSAPVVDYGRLPLSFEPNQGQADPQVRFLSRGNGYSLLLTESEAVLALKNRKAAHTPGSQDTPGLLRMQLSGANHPTAIAAEDKLPGSVNYFIGNDPQQWHAGLPTYARVRYHNIYAGIDLVYYGNQSQLEYDFVVAPNANPNRIHLHFAGARHLRIDASGNLIVSSGDGDLLFHKPVVYQTSGDRRLPVQGNFNLLADNSVRFTLGSYDHARNLVIDPTLSYSTFLGGSTLDEASAIAVDSSGNAYVTGLSESSDFPTTTGAYDKKLTDSSKAFITKMNAAGTALLYSTFLGGTDGDGGNGIAVDTSGNAYITGETSSNNFPTTTGAFQRKYTSDESSMAFVTKLNSTGSALVYSTYLGGSGADSGASIAVDTQGNAYVTGSTYSTDFPTTAGAFQTVFSGGGVAFVTKLNPSGSAPVYSTLLGGDNYDSGAAIAIDSSGNAYVTGYNLSDNFPVTAGAYQTTNLGPDDPDAQAGFITKLNPSGSAPVYSTYFISTPASIAVDASGSAYITGNTDITPPDFPVTAGAYQSTIDPNATEVAFVTKFNPAGSALVYSTYLGGDNYDHGDAITVDNNGNAYITGGAFSSNFPVTSDAYQSTNNAAANSEGAPFLTEMNATGSALTYSTFFGGSGTADDSDFDVNYGVGIALDPTGNIYIAGYTDSPDYPTTPGAFQTTFKDAGNESAFVAKFNSSPALIATMATLTSDGNPQYTGTAVTFTAWVQPASGAAIPTGTVVFTIDGSAGSPINLDNTGHASCATTTLTVGSHTIAATYSGSSTNQGSTSNTLSEVIQSNPTPAPVISPAAGTYASAQTVTLTDTVSGAVINYTTDSTTPTTASATYTSPISVASSKTIKAIATASGYTTSTVASATYIINTVSMSPSSLAFPATALGSTSAAQSVTLSNPGSTALTVKSFTFSGTNATAFLITAKTCGTSLAAGATCTVSVAFKPTSTGVASASFLATDAAANSPQAVALSASTPATGTATLTPATLNFPATAVGLTSAAQSVTFTNTGASAITVSAFTFTGTGAAQFAISGKNCASSLAAGASCTLLVAFRPTAAGAASASFLATDNAGNSPQTVALSGSTPAATGAATLSPTALTFPSTAVGSTSAAQTVTFTNTGASAITVSSFTFTGANAPQFVIAGKNCTSSLAAGASCTLLLAFKPTSAGSASAAFSAADNASNAPQSVSLTGTGH